MAKELFSTLEELLDKYPKYPIGRAIDLTGRKINKSTFLFRAKTNDPRIAWWALRCDCGNYYIARAYSVLTGNTTSCGREQLKARFNSNHIKDITGCRFGFLTVLSLVGKDNRGNSRWLCECECGNKTVVSACNLKSGGTISCGCCKNQKSSYELRIERWLQQHNYDFETQYKVPELGQQRFDFKINLTGQKYALLEMQGQQHFYPIDYFGGEAKFRIQQQHDQQKLEYCQNNNIPFFTIKYNENIEDKLTKFFTLSSND